MHPLEFVEDSLYGAPQDVNYPERGYVAPDQQEFSMKYKLPLGLTGERVLLQWKYLTGNSCLHPGYDECVT